MHKYQKVAQLVEKAYVACNEDFGKWMWKNHVPVVAQIAEQLSIKYGADLDLCIAGALLHDFGDAFMYRFADNHEEVSETKAREVLSKSGYSENEIEIIMQEVIAPHSCRTGDELPKTKDAQVLSTADALTHLTTDFYVQFTWKHIPEGKIYTEFLTWVTEKLDRDFNRKIFFDEINEDVRYRYDALMEVFVTK
jgi:putative nucleotidyltransferase with HDIG domain